MKRLFYTAILAFATIFSATFTFQSTPLHAESTPENALEQALLAIDFAGRQRMFAQRMAGLSCLVHMDIEAEANSAEAVGIRDRFALTLVDLRMGNADIGLSREINPKVLESINTAAEPFEQISELLSVLESQNFMSVQRLQAISVLTNSVFTTSDQLTSQIQAARNQALQDLPLITAMIINISGRQRMLAEKAFKELCLIQAGVDIDINLENLAATITIFDNTMTALINGMPGLIPAPPNEEIKSKLLEVQAIWLPAKDLLDQAIDGEKIETTELHFLSGELETVRILMNQAVKLYEEAAED
ncbi:MAG: type IV pili methyl-accepting chemotaxis transducer N-terminal domain-containing protein [Rhodobacteraceae bacterium]|nr:type IV pili methyl-accepting chemotaxis transducer N-terminal domain-containing protein [Paracoccaceae bacterium]